MAAHFEGYYALSHIKNAQKGSFSAANGSAVDMQKHARATVAFETVKTWTLNRRLLQSLCSTVLSVRRGITS